MDRVIAMMTGVYSDAHIPRTLSRRLIATGFQMTDQSAFCVLNWEPDGSLVNQPGEVGTQLLDPFDLTQDVSETDAGIAYAVLEELEARQLVTLHAQQVEQRRRRAQLEDRGARR